MTIQDLPFKELLKRGYKLEGRTRVWDLADSKLWYLSPKQAKGYLDLEKTKKYKHSVIDKEVALIKQHIPDVVDAFSFRHGNIIDLGCGDGKKAALFIDELNKHLDIRYCPIDISAYMVRKAAETIRKLNVGEVLEFKWNISDFENLGNIVPLFRDGRFQNHLMLMLGNTLGNFDRDDLLSGIQTSMEDGDVLLIANGISNETNIDWVDSYRDELFDKWLIQVAKAVGLSRNDAQYDVRFVNSRIEEIYTVKHNKKIKHLGRTVQFLEGDILRVVISYKYTCEDLQKMLSKFFTDVKIYTNQEGTYALGLCKK